MKTFKIVRQQYAILGLGSPSNQPTQNHRLNGKILISFLLFGCNFSSETVYTFRVADGFMECTMLVSSISGVFTMFVGFAAVVYRKAKLYECFGDIEKLIDASKMV